MAGPTDLFDLAADLLAAAAASLDEIQSPLVGAPERQIVTPGLPVDDCCEQLTVHVNPVNEGTTRPLDPGQPGRRHSRAWINQVTFRVTVGRCIPGVEVTGTGKPVLPDPDDLQAAAEQVYADGWALWNGIHNRVAAGDLFGTCANVVFEPLTSRDPSGGCAGWVMEIRVYVSGYRAAGS